MESSACESLHPASSHLVTLEPQRIHVTEQHCGYNFEVVPSLYTCQFGVYTFRTAAERCVEPTNGTQERAF